MVIALLAAGCLTGGSFGVAAGSLLVVAVGLPFLRRLRRDGLDPPAVYVLMTVITFGLMSGIWLTARPFTAPPGLGRDDVAHALLLVSVGVAAFCLGARLLGPAQPRKPLVMDAEASPQATFLLLLFGVSAGALLIGLVIGATGYTAALDRSPALAASSQLIVQLGAIGPMAILAAALTCFATPERRFRRLVPLLLAVQALVGFASGFKGQSVIPFIFVGLAFIACRGRVPWRPVVVLGAVVVIVLLPANAVYRATLRPAVGVERDNSPRALVRDAYIYGSSRFRYIDHVALIEARTPSLYEYGSGARYVWLPALVAVPRVIWSAKPILDDGLEFSHTYWDIPLAIKTSTPLTQIGDLYRNFAWPGVIAGLAVWGLVVAAFGAACRRWRSPRTEMVLIYALVTAVPYVESDLPQLIAAATRSLPVAAACAWLLLPGRGGAQPGYRRVLVGFRALRAKAFPGYASPATEEL